MRDDARFLTLLFLRAPPPCPVDKVHQTLLLNGRIFCSSKSKYELQISFTLRLKYAYKHSTKHYLTSPEKQEIVAPKIAPLIVSESL